MQVRLLTRVGAIAFVAVALTATALQMREVPVSEAPSGSAPAAAETADALRAELSRCQSLGAAGATDTACLAAWDRNRRRFFGLDPVQPDPAPANASGVH